MRWVRILGLAVAVLAPACDLTGHDDDGVCLAIGIASIAAEIRDTAGNPAAIGATVTIEKISRRDSAEGFGDPLRILVNAGNEGGVFEVRVRKPWHADVVIPRVFVPAGRCGVSGPKVVPVTIPLLPEAPAVRQIVLPPFGYGFGPSVCGSRFPITAYVLTAAGVSPAATWISSDESVVRIEQESTSADGRSTAVLVPQCRPGPAHAFVIARAVADPTVRDSVEVGLFAR